MILFLIHTDNLVLEHSLFIDAWWSKIERKHHYILHDATAGGLGLKTKMYMILLIEELHRGRLKFHAIGQAKVFCSLLISIK